MELSDRQMQILSAVVRNYILSGVPVGSRTLARSADIGVSAATIRNEMADLEEIGLLEHPYTSSGRIPSDAGYRVYVDNLMPKVLPDVLAVERIEAEIDQRVHEKELLIRGLAETLSEVTSYTTIISGPYVNSSALRELMLVPANENTVVILIVTDNGLTTHKTLHLPAAMTAEEIGFINRVLNDAFKGRYLTEISDDEVDRLLWRIRSHLNREDLALKSLIHKVIRTKANPVISDGLLSVLSQPEFRTGDRHLELLEALQAKENLIQLLDTGPDSAVNVVIGQELNDEKMKECSIVKVPYFLDNRLAGVIGILGPRRMTYSRVIALLNYVSQRVEDILQE